MMTTWIVAGFITFGPPGPIDTCCANVASVKVSMKFRCSYFHLDDVNLEANLERVQRSLPQVAPDRTYEGSWESDGSAESYSVTALDGEQSDSDDQSGPLVPSEVLTDGTLVAYHYLRRGERALHVTQSDRIPFPVVGPLTPCSTVRIDREIENEFSDPPKRLGVIERYGALLDYCIFTKKTNSAIVVREIGFDPNVGFLPRFYRGVAWIPGDNREPASVKDLYVIESKECNGGGFIPIEWLLHIYDVHGYDANYAEDGRAVTLKPAGGSTLVHFKATDFSESPTPAKMSRLNEVEVILGPGGRSAGSFRNLTLANLKTRLGDKIRPSRKAVLPNIDIDEQKEFERHRGASKWKLRPLAILVAIALVILVWIMIRRKIRVLMLFAVALSLGCSVKPVPSVECKFALPKMVFEPSSPSLSIELCVNNIINCPLRIFNVDAGCSCRHVDKSVLPVDLEPGGSARLLMNLNGSRT